MALFIFEMIAHLRSFIVDSKIIANENSGDFKIRLKFGKDPGTYNFEIKFQISCRTETNSPKI